MDGVYTLTDGMRVKSAKTWNEALNLAHKWSHRTGKVISILEGSLTQTYVYGGREITGKEASAIWMDEEIRNTYMGVM